MLLQTARLVPRRGLAYSASDLGGLPQFTSNKKLLDWVNERAKQLGPANVQLVTGTEEANKKLVQELVQKGVMEPLNPKLRPNSYLTRTDPADVARAEQSTFICSDTKEDAGPTNNWVDPAEMRKTLNEDFNGAMKGTARRLRMKAPGMAWSDVGASRIDAPWS